MKIYFFNPFYATGLFLYALKISENESVFVFLRGYRKSPVSRNELIIYSLFVSIWQKNVKTDMGGADSKS